MTTPNNCTIEDAIAQFDLMVGAATDVEEDMENSGISGANAEPEGGPISDKHVFLRTAGLYRAYAVDLEFLWRWEIYLEDDHLVQHGAALSLASATEAVGHVLAYYSVRDSHLTRGGTDVHCP